MERGDVVRAKDNGRLLIVMELIPVGVGIHKMPNGVRAYLPDDEPFITVVVVGGPMPADFSDDVKREVEIGHCRIAQVEPATVFSYEQDAVDEAREWLDFYPPVPLLADIVPVVQPC